MNINFLKNKFLQKNQKYIVFDFEACNLNRVSRENLPWEIGYIVFEGLIEKERVEEFLDWGNLKISADAARVTGFDPIEYHKHKKDPVPIFSKFVSMINSGEYFIVFHNGLRYDLTILRNACEKLGIKYDCNIALKMSLDTDCLSKAYKENMKFPREIDDEDEFVFWQLRLSNLKKKGLKTNVGAMCAELGIENDESKRHRALYDVEKTHQIFIKLISKLS